MVGRRVMLLVSSQYRPGKLLIFYMVQHSPTTKKHVVQTVNSAEVEKPWPRLAEGKERHSLLRFSFHWR